MVHSAMRSFLATDSTGRVMEVAHGFLFRIFVLRLTKVQLQRWIWFLCGLGYFMDLLWAQAIGLILVPLQEEFGFTSMSILANPRVLC